jgi:hypothetical protein
LSDAPITVVFRNRIVRRAAAAAKRKASNDLACSKEVVTTCEEMDAIYAVDASRL